MKKGLFAKKSIKALLHESSDVRTGLKRTLGPVNLVSLGIGAIIGAGIFVMTGQAAAEYAGPAITLSFVFAALICVFSALCYAEFASLIPIAGSAYSYAYVTMGEFAAWIIGWGLTLEYLFSASTVAVGWSGYFVSLLKDFGLIIPKYLSDSPFIYDPKLGWESSGALLNLPAMAVMLVIGVMIALGIKTAAKFNAILVVIKMGVILLFIACGVGYIQTENWHPFIPENTGVFGQYGFSGILRGAGLVFFAFIGFDAISTLAQEARNPQKDMPKGMLGSLGICTIVYIIVALVLTGIVSYTKLSVPDPIAVGVDALGTNFLWLRFVIKIAILAGLSSVVLVMLLGQARVFYAMSQDGLLPPLFGKVHPKFQTPFFNTILITLCAMVIAGLFPVGILGQITTMGALLAFAIVCFGVLILRHTQPLLHRPFKTPLVPWIPLLGTLSCVVQMVFLQGTTWVQFIIWMLIGISIYFWYGQHHSKIRNAKK